jgi:hypothetical protein
MKRTVYYSVAALIFSCMLSTVSIAQNRKPVGVSSSGYFTMSSDTSLLRVSGSSLDAVPVTYVGPGGDVMSFPVTTAITKATIGTDGIDVEFTKRDGSNRWPDTKNFEPVGMGPLQYSIGLALSINGTWYGSAPIEFWHGRSPAGTGQIQDQTVTCPQGFHGQVACNWFYDSRWAQLMGHQPAAGETVGLFVVYGDARNNVYELPDGSKKFERSNVVTFKLPATGQSAVFEFPDKSPICVNCLPLPVPTTPAPQPGVAGPTGPQGSAGPQGPKGDPGDVPDLSGILARLAALEAQVGEVKARAVPVSCSAALNLGATKIPISCRLSF